MGLDVGYVVSGNDANSCPSKDAWDSDVPDINMQGCLNPGLPYQPCGGNVGTRSRQYESLELAVGERLCPAYTLYTLEAASPGGWSQVDIRMMQDGGTSRFLNSQPSGPRSWLEVSGMAEGDGDDKA